MAKGLGLQIASRHSTLFQWMVANREEFAAEKAKAGRPDWTKIAATLAAPPLGLRDADGKPPTGSVARQTWWRVERAAAKTNASAKQAPASAPPEQAEQAEPKPAAAPLPAPTAAPKATTEPPPPKLPEPPRRVFRASGGERVWTAPNPEEKKG
jgi:hypothetical protein